MAKKRKDTHQNHKENRVLSEIRGTLEDAFDEIPPELNYTEVQQNFEPEPKPSKNKIYLITGVFVLIMAIVGCISTFNGLIGVFKQLADDSSIKNEFALFVLPVVVNDTPAFDSAETLSDEAKIHCGIWNILLVSSDKDKYEVEDGYMKIPSVDVDYNINYIFGGGNLVEHKTVGDIELMFNYDQEIKSYIVPANPRYIPYAPDITEVTNVGETYTVIVGYSPPYIASIPGADIQKQHDKYMEYTISRSGKKNTLISVKYSKINQEITH